jgi:predicted Zn-dependent peptidase
MRLRRHGCQAVLFAVGIAAFLAAPRFAGAQDLASFERRVTLKTLSNGLTLIVCERPVAPVFSFFIHVDVGSSQEVPGITGLAHMFEHMAFKGTDRIGTTDYAAEKLALEKVEQAYAAYDAERRKRVGRDPARVAALEKAWREAIAAADRFVVKNEFSRIVEGAGGVGMNAFTSHDETGYFYSLPANRLELWAWLESERFLRPVMREFYKERDVVREERRMRIDSRPTGRLFEEFQATAFTAHPYGQPGIGWPSDLDSFSASDATRFYEIHYVPANVVIAVVGDVRASEVVSLAERYFGRWPARPKPPPLRTVEPRQRVEREVLLRERAQPLYIEGYHKPDIRDPDDPVFAVIQDLMTTGRTSRLYRSLVRDKRIAAAAGGFNGYPGAKYPNLFVFYAVPTPGHTTDEVRQAIATEIERLKQGDVSDEELKMVRTRAKAALLRKLDSNLGLAIQLATTQARLGDWRELFRRVDRIGQVTREDIQRVSRRTFRRENRTVGRLETLRPAAAGGALR